MSEQTYTFKVKGMHCAACEFLLEDKLTNLPGVTKIKANLKNNSIEVNSSSELGPEELARELTLAVAAQGYTVHTSNTATPINYAEFTVAVPAALSFIIAFLLLQKLGLVNLISAGHFNYFTAFVIGLIASVSTCLAVVGGLILSISANAAKGAGRWQSQLLFHVGRLSGFFVLGGVIGALGKVFQLSFTGAAILGVILGLVMLILGINLLDIFPAAKNLQLRMPKFLTKRAKILGDSASIIAPLLAGVATFFLPCGFTQSMQFYTLSTGNFFTGGFTMLAFALGTLPVLGLLSFGAFEVSHKPWKGTFFKAIGLIIIAMALFNLANSLATLGFMPVVFNI